MSILTRQPPDPISRESSGGYKKPDRSKATLLAKLLSEKNLRQLAISTKPVSVSVAFIAYYRTLRSMVHASPRMNHESSALRLSPGSEFDVASRSLVRRWAFRQLRCGRDDHAAPVVERIAQGRTVPKELPNRSRGQLPLSSGDHCNQPSGHHGSVTSASRHPAVRRCLQVFAADGPRQFAGRCDRSWNNRAGTSTVVLSSGVDREALGNESEALDMGKGSKRIDRAMKIFRSGMIPSAGRFLSEVRAERIVLEERWMPACQALPSALSANFCSKGWPFCSRSHILGPWRRCRPASAIWISTR